MNNFKIKVDGRVEINDRLQISYWGEEQPLATLGHSYPTSSGEDIYYLENGACLLDLMITSEATKDIFGNPKSPGPYYTLREKGVVVEKKVAITHINRKNLAIIFRKARER